MPSALATMDTVLVSTDGSVYSDIQLPVDYDGKLREFICLLPIVQTANSISFFSSESARADFLRTHRSAVVYWSAEDVKPRATDRNESFSALKTWGIVKELLAAPDAAADAAGTAACVSSPAGGATRFHYFVNLAPGGKFCDYPPASSTLALLALRP